MKLYLDGVVVVEKETPKFGTKMWVFANDDIIEPKVTKYSDMIFIQDVNSYNLTTHYIDEDLQYWLVKRCFFKQKEVDEEIRRRINKKFGDDSNGKN